MFNQVLRNLLFVSLLIPLTATSVLAEPMKSARPKDPRNSESIVRP